MLKYSEPKSFCSGQVIFQNAYEYTLEDVIFLLENREFSEFRINSDELSCVIIKNHILHKKQNPETTYLRDFRSLKYGRAEGIEKVYGIFASSSISSKHS